MIRSRIFAVATMLASLSIASSALAQTSTAQPGTDRPELTMGALASGPATLGTVSADFTRPDGSSFEQFRTKNSLSSRFGVEAILTFPLTSRLAVEGAGSWSRGDVESRIESDFEGASLVTAATGLSRFTVEGGAVFTLMQRSKLTWFARGSAGWMRELTGENVIAEDGITGNVGTGVKYWFRAPGLKRRGMGVRIEGRANARSRGVELGQDKLRVAGVLFGGFIVGW